MVWIFGSFLSWRMTAFLMMVPALALILLLSKLPETPYWLIQDGQLGMARRSLQYFRGKRSYRLPIFTTKLLRKYNKNVVFWILLLRIAVPLYF